MVKAPDTVFVRGYAFSPPTPGPVRCAVAVSSGLVMGVGRDEDMLELAKSGTEVVDLAGGLLLPGFVDTHVHPIRAGVEMLRCNLYDATSASDTLERVRAHACQHLDLSWIVGGGWSTEHFPGSTATRKVLDTVARRRGVFLTSRDGLSAWVNSRALLLAGLDAATEDPPGGRIEREADGLPSGLLHGGAVQLVRRVLPDAGPKELLAGLSNAQKVLFSKGITAWQDAGAGPLLEQDDLLEVYLRADASGRLKARVVGALCWDWDRGCEQIPDLVDRRIADQLGRFASTTVTLSQGDPVAMREHVQQLDANGFQVHFHVPGEFAARDALDAVQAAREANGPRDRRHVLAGARAIHSDDIERFQMLEVVAGIHPACDQDSPMPGGSGRCSFKDLFRAGARVCVGSDWPAAIPDPMAGIQLAVNRMGPNSISLAQGLTAYTAGGAYANHRLCTTGRIIPGARADLAVLERNPFDGPKTEIASARVVRTYVDGELVYCVEP